jgi:hypothetical protein
MSELNANSRPEWGLFDLLDPMQLGFLYESLIKNANDNNLNSPLAKDYLEKAEQIKDAIDSNCGWKDYQQHHQADCRSMADYDGRMGWRKDKP